MTIFYGPLFPIYTPDDSDFGWVNQGGASTITNSEGGIFLSTPVGASENCRVRQKAVPSAPYTLTAGFLPLWAMGGNPMCGIGLRDSVSGALIFFSIYFDATSLVPVLHIRKLDSPTVFNTDGTTNRPSAFLVGLLFLRIVDDNVNRKYYFSKDGENFNLYFSESRTAFITPNQIFFGVNALGTTGDICGMTLLSWLET